MSETASPKKRRFWQFWQLRLGMAIVFGMCLVIISSKLWPQYEHTLTHAGLAVLFLTGGCLIALTAIRAILSGVIHNKRSEVLRSEHPLWFWMIVTYSAAVSLFL